MTKTRREPNRKKLVTSYTLSSETKDLVARLAAHHGLSMSSVVEMSLREHGRTLGIFPKMEDQEEG